MRVKMDCNYLNCCCVSFHMTFYLSFSICESVAITTCSLQTAPSSATKIFSPCFDWNIMQSSSHSYLSFLEKFRLHIAIQRNLSVAVHTLNQTPFLSSSISLSMTAASHMGNNTFCQQKVWLSTYVWANNSFSTKFHFRGTLLMYRYPFQPTCTDLQQHLFPKERSFLVSAIMTNAYKCSL